MLGLLRPALGAVAILLFINTWNEYLWPLLGKTTALRIVSGSGGPTAGRLLIDDTDVTGVAPGQHGASMVFQDFALYPHMTVERDITFGLRLEAKHNRESGLDRAEIERRVAQVCSSLGLTGLRRRRPGQLSGGERQRVWPARTIVRRKINIAGRVIDSPTMAQKCHIRTPHPGPVAAQAFCAHPAGVLSPPRDHVMIAVCVVPPVASDHDQAVRLYRPARALEVPLFVARSAGEESL